MDLVLLFRCLIGFAAASVVVDITARSMQDVFAWQFGWDHGTENPVWFWLKNTASSFRSSWEPFFWRGKGYLISRRLLIYYLPFTLCFIVQFDQTRSVGVGQYQGALLLVLASAS